MEDRDRWDGTLDGALDDLADLILVDLVLQSIIELMLQTKHVLTWERKNKIFQLKINYLSISNWQTPWELRCLRSLVFRCYCLQNGFQFPFQLIIPLLLFAYESLIACLTRLTKCRSIDKYLLCQLRFKGCKQ